MGRMVLTVLGMVTEMELGFIRDRQWAGIEAAKARGVYKGRPITFDHAKIRPAERGAGSDRDRSKYRMQTGKRLQGAESSGGYLGDRRAIEDAEANREPHKALDKRFAGSVSSLRRHRLPRRLDSVSSIIDPAQPLSHR
jgi:hypothetical protein